MSTLVVRTIQTPDGSPVSFPNGIRIGTAIGAGTMNNIGTPGQQGFGVGIAPSLPTGFSKLYGTEDPTSDTYGNYQTTDGSVMCYIPAFYYKFGTGANGYALNVCDIKPFSYFEAVASAAAAGYALHRAFYNGGSVRPGFFADKYLVSKNGTVASSVKNGVALSSATRTLATTPYSSIGQTDNYRGSIGVAKTRGSSFHAKTIFQNSALALLSLAHASAATGSTYCAWYSATSTNYPKGCNNNALGDANDATIAYTSDGTTGVTGKTGSANFLAKTTHNGMNSGVADLNGLLWETTIGLTSDGTNYYLLNTSVDVNTITAGSTLATDAWGATGLAAMYTNIGATYGALTASNSNKPFGSAAQVLSEATSGVAWAMAGAGIPLATGVGGSAQFGSDYMLDYRPAEMCPFVGGSWSNSVSAGVWAVNCFDVAGSSYSSVGCRSACYL